VKQNSKAASAWPRPVTDLTGRIASTLKIAIDSFGRHPEPSKCVGNAVRQQRSGNVSQWAFPENWNRSFRQNENGKAERLESFCERTRDRSAWWSFSRTGRGATIRSNSFKHGSHSDCHRPSTMPRQIELTCQGYERLFAYSRDNDPADGRGPLMVSRCEAAWNWMGIPQFGEIIRASPLDPSTNVGSDAKSTQPDPQRARVRLKRTFAFAKHQPQWLRMPLRYRHKTATLSICPLLTGQCRPHRAVQLGRSGPNCLLPTRPVPSIADSGILDRSFTNASIRMLARKNPLAFQTSQRSMKRNARRDVHRSLASKATGMNRPRIVLADWPRFDLCPSE